MGLGSRGWCAFHVARTSTVGSHSPGGSETVRVRPPKRGYAQDVFTLDHEDWIFVALPCGERRDPVLPRVVELKSQEGVQCQPPKDGWADGSSELGTEISALE